MSFTNSAIDMTIYVENVVILILPI